MRIKLRLGADDLDLIALKYNRNFKFSYAVKRALLEYVTSGECTRIQVPYDSLTPVGLVPVQIDITLNETEFSDVISWIKGIRKGLRNTAVKIIIRSAISNPNMGLLMIKNDHLIAAPARVEAQVGSTLYSNPTGELCTRPNPTVHFVNEPLSQNKELNNEEEFDLFASDFFDQY